MTFEAALVDELATITALNNRIYPLQAPEERFELIHPYCIFASSEGVRTKEIGSGYQSGRAVRAEINIMAPRYTDMKSITAAVVDQLVSMEQRVIGTNGPFIQEVTYQTPVELYEERPKLYRSVVEFDVYF